MTAHLALPWFEAPTLVLDLETTGLDPEGGDRVIELAALGPGEERLHSLVDPQRPISSTARAIHGIDEEMLRGQPRFAALWPQLGPRLEGAVLVAHNARVDLAFLRAECARAGLPSPRPLAVIDTLHLARGVFGLVRCSLAALAERLGIPHPQPHRALPDALVAREVYRAMLRALCPQEDMSMDEVLRLLASPGRAGAHRRQILAQLREALAEERPVFIEYTSAAGGPLCAPRRITVTRLRPPYVEAICHLRQQPRVFKLNRVRRVWSDER